MAFIIRGLVVSILIQISPSLVAQDLDFGKNVISLELLGISGRMFSVSYERIFNFEAKQISGLAIRQSFSMSENQNNGTKVYIFPIEFNFLYGKKAHKIESGCGVTLNFGTTNLFNPNQTNYTSNFDYAYSFRLGYRYYEQGILIARLAPIIIMYHDPYDPSKFKAFVTISASIGLQFNPRRK